MTEQEIRDLGQQWIYRLGLQNWKIEFPFGNELREYWKDQGDMRDSHAGCWRAKHYNEAKVYVNADEYEGWSAEEAVGHIVHELVHVLMRDVEYVLDMIEDSMPKDTMSIVDQVYIHHVEGAVDNIARLFIKAWADEDAPY